MREKTMKRKIAITIPIVLIAVLFGALFIVQVPTKQGVNYKVSSYKMPLYIKMIEFADRDYHYRRIVKEITAGKRSDADKITAIFKWCVEHVAHQPDGLPVIDDHPYSIIIRGYGAEDQLEDVFTLLCTYAGYESFYKAFRPPSERVYFISFIRFGGRWHAFSTWGNAYPAEGGRPIPVDAIRSRPQCLAPLSVLAGFDASVFLDELDTMRFEAASMRVKGQSPAGRILIYLRRAIQR